MVQMLRVNVKTECAYKYIIIFALPNYYLQKFTKLIENVIKKNLF